MVNESGQEGTRGHPRELRHEWWSCCAIRRPGSRSLHRVEAAKPPNYQSFSSDINLGKVEILRQILVASTKFADSSNNLGLFPAAVVHLSACMICTVE